MLEDTIHEIFEDIRNKIRNEVRDEVKKEAKKEIRDKVKNEIRDEIKKEVETEEIEKHDKQIATNLLKMGIAIEQIMQATGLPRQDVISLQTENSDAVGTPIAERPRTEPCLQISRTRLFI